jgi:hypothetical protein
MPNASLPNEAKCLGIGIVDGFAAYQKVECQREPTRHNAVERLRDLLRDAMPEDEIARLVALGAQLTEDQAMTLALGG